MPLIPLDFVLFAVTLAGVALFHPHTLRIALTGPNVFPEGKSVAGWLRHGWHVALAHVVGFAVMMLLLAGWHPHAPHRPSPVGGPPAEAH